ncbi:reverse transcriptase domain-containing protein [Enterococcus sp. DIV1283b]
MLTDGQILYPKKGTPQGGILSPLLANINLNEFDWWATNQWENRYCEEIKRVYNQNGSEDKGHHYRKLRSSTKLKEFYLVRYADDFKLFCVNRRTAWKVFYATRKWLATRLKLPISEEKSKVTNLKKQDSEFLGFTIKKMQSKNRNIMRSHISPKALKAIEYQLKEQIKKIQRNPNSQKTIEEIRRYNSKVIGIHQYYRIATCVSIDLKKVHYRCLLLMKNRLSGNGLTKNGKYMGTDKGIIPYARSPMMRYLQRQPLLPIGLIKTKNALFKKRSICKYTEAGRKEMHSKQSSVSKFKLGILRNLPIKGVRGTTELNDNRISLFIAQKGLCGIMGQELEIHDMHCHHKIPYHLTNDDSYNNLILLGSLPHRLIHVIKEETIRKYMNVVNPNSEQLEKLNKLREMAGNEKIFLN